MKQVFLVCVLAIFTLDSVTSKCEYHKSSKLFERSVYEFSSDLTERIAKLTDYHFVSSPFSIWTLITLASKGAKDETMLEIIKVLGLRRQCFVNHYLNRIKTTLATEDTLMEKSSSIFIDDSVVLKPEFSDMINKKNISRIMNVSFQNRNIAAEVINRYINESTHGTIDGVVDPESLYEVLVVLIDTIYFKSNWLFPFNEEMTKLNMFYDDEGNEIGNVNMMTIMQPFNVTTIDKINAQVLELPYNDRFSMLILLPFDSLPKLLESLKETDLMFLLASLKGTDFDDVRVWIPRFKIETKLDNLKDILYSMGLQAMFESRADFSGMSNQNLYVSDIVQRVFMNVNEKGTEASVATDMNMNSRSMPHEFEANKPFLYMIIDKEQMVPLFIGCYSKPNIE